MNRSKPQHTSPLKTVCILYISVQKEKEQKKLMKRVCVCVSESDSFHELNEDLTSACQTEANGNISYKDHVCIFLFTKLHFHVTTKQHRLGL